MVFILFKSNKVKISKSITVFTQMQDVYKEDPPKIKCLLRKNILPLTAYT